MTILATEREDLAEMDEAQAPQALEDLEDCEDFEVFGEAEGADENEDREDLAELAGEDEDEETPESFDGLAELEDSESFELFENGPGLSLGRGAVVLLVGDSHTDGPFGAELERLMKEGGATVSRVARSGSAVKYWYPRLPNLLRQRRPGVVMVALGANMRAYPSATGTSRQVSDLVQLIARERPGAHIIWIGPPRQRDDSEATLQRFNETIRRGLGTSATFIDSAGHTPRYEGRDGVHYTATAAKMWARGVFSRLAPVGAPAPAAPPNSPIAAPTPATASPNTAAVSRLATISRHGLRTSGGRRRRPVFGIIVHTTGGGPAAQASRTKRNPLACALTVYAHNKGFPHYVIGYDGEIVAVCPEDHIAWHSGVSSAARRWLSENGAPRWWIRIWSGVARSPLELPPSGRANEQHIGIELLQTENGGSYSDAQYRSLAALIVDIEQRHGLKLDRPPNRALLGHEDVNPAPYQSGSIGGRSLDNLSAGWDPGATRGWFSWDKLWSLMRSGAQHQDGGPAPSPGRPVPPQDPSAYRRFRLTSYCIADQADYPTGSVVVPIYDPSGKKLAECSPRFFAKMSLEGTGRLLDGRLLNVAGKGKVVPVDPAVFAPVWEYHKHNLVNKRKVMRDPGYSGLIVADDRVVKVLAFHEVPRTKLGRGYGVQHGIPLEPYRTLAADIGAYRTSAPAFKGKGGLVPVGTRVFIKDFRGLKLPDNTVHDGWFTVNDTGGGIFGVHFDVFTGSQKTSPRVRIPEHAHVWFEGIERRIAPNETYGLHDL